jgi:putative DNA methylase
VNPESRKGLLHEPSSTDWRGASGLADDVHYYGEWMKKEAFERIGHLYPKVKDEHGHEHTVIAWIWARTVKCPNPACGCEMPLASSFVLSKKKGKETWIEPIIDNENNKIRYSVKTGKGKAPEPSKTARGAKFKCIKCGASTTPDYIKDEAMTGRMGAHLMAVVAEGKNGRLYIAPDDIQSSIANVSKPTEYPNANLPDDPRNIWCVSYGLDTYDKLFTNRQLTALTTFSDLVAEAQAQIEHDALQSPLFKGGAPEGGGGLPLLPTRAPKEQTPVIAEGDATPFEKGAWAREYGQAVGVYLAMLVDQLANHNSSICGWHVNNVQLRNTFARQAIPMTWDYAESNPFCSSTGSYNNLFERQIKGFQGISANLKGFVSQSDAQSDNGLRNIMISTDPPYYDNIGYADLSDFFYIWLRRSLKDTYPKLFSTMLVPKTEELVATPYRFEGSKEKARNFFENGMLKTFSQIFTYAREDVPVTIYYAFKQSESEDDGDDAQTASTGWETMLSAVIQAGFSITGTWPMRTEMVNRSLGLGTNALASSIVLVCRKRPADAPVCTRRDFINTLKRELKPALQKLQASNIAPVDLAQSAIGPGMGVYSRFSKVLEADGTPMSVRSALQIINQELDLYFTEQDGELDRDSRFCVDLYTQYAFNDMKFGEADVLARAKNTSVEKLASRGVLYAQKGVVRLLTREEIPEKIDSHDIIIWQLTQQLTRAMEHDGVTGSAKIVADMLTSEPEYAKALAYRLFQIAERKGWAAEAYAYNSLVVAWPDVQSKAAELQAQAQSGKQMTLFDEGDE